MSVRDDGGPAFPAPELGEMQFGDRTAYSGMSLRDHFAGLALQGMLANPEDFTIESEGDRLADNWADFAKCAYEAADAMIRARGAA